MKKMIFKSVLVAALMVLIKWVLVGGFFVPGEHAFSLVEVSDAGAVFTGAFFVVGLLLAGIMTDFKESEKIPGEIACNLEAIQDWMLLGLKAPRSNDKAEKAKAELDKNYFYNTLSHVTDQILAWIKSNGKKSQELFPVLRKLNDSAYYLAEHYADKEAVKGIQENTNVMRKQLTRAYIISRTDFLAPAYALMYSIVVGINLLLLVCKFKTVGGALIVTGLVSFVFVYLTSLVRGLDDPFELTFGSTDTEVDLKPIERFRERLKDGFQ